MEYKEKKRRGEKEEKRRRYRGELRMGEDRRGAERNLDSRLEKKRGEGREDSRGRREREQRRRKCGFQGFLV